MYKKNTTITGFRGMCGFSLFKNLYFEVRLGSLLTNKRAVDISLTVKNEVHQ